MLNCVISFANTSQVWQQIKRRKFTGKKANKRQKQKAYKLAHMTN